MQRAAAAALQAVASRKRPVVLFLDDLQWAGRTVLGFVDLVLSEDPIEGLLLVGAYRDSAVDAAHPLAARLSRWLDQAMVRRLRLANLPEPSLVAMVAEMLRADRAAAAALAGMISPHTSGNPYVTVELLNALRRDGRLTATAAGWRWDSAAVRAHLGRSEVAGLLAARVDALPPASGLMLEAMACLGGRAELSLLQAAAGEPGDVVDQALAPALDVQVFSLTHRNRFAEAIGLGRQALRGVGITVPAADRLAAELDHRFGSWYRWLDHTEAADDLARPGLTDPTLLAASGLINATLTAAFFVGDAATLTWLGLEALRICREHGPAPAQSARWRPAAPGHAQPRAARGAGGGAAGSR